MTRDDPLTEIQRSIFNWMVRYTIDHFYQPSIRDIGDNFGLSVNGVMNNLKGLHVKGLICLRGKCQGPNRPLGLEGARSPARAIEFLRRTPIED